MIFHNFNNENKNNWKNNACNVCRENEIDIFMCIYVISVYPVRHYTYVYRIYVYRSPMWTCICSDVYYTSTLKTVFSYVPYQAWINSTYIGVHILDIVIVCTEPVILNLFTDKP